MNYFVRFLFLIFLFSRGLGVQGQTTSIMTFNIKFDNPNDGVNAWEQRKRSLVELIGRYKPDILGIQEGLYHQVEFINQHLSNHAYVGVGRDDGKKKGEYSAIYYDSTRFEFIAYQTFWLSGSPDRVSVGWDAAMERICTYGAFRSKTSDDTLHVFNAHFDHVGNEAREMSARLILSKIEEFGLRDERIVVMGDFNAAPGSDPINVFQKELDYGHEISQSKFQGSAGTYNAFDKYKLLTEPIDFIFTKHLEVFTYRHIEDRRENDLFISDHFPVIIEVKF